MSHYTTYTGVKFLNVECLLQALAELGFDSSKVEVAEDNTLGLEGYDGRMRYERGEQINGAVRIKRRYVGSASNDLGFAWRDVDGKRVLVPIISDYDSTRYGKKWTDRLQQFYTVSMAKKIYTPKGYQVNTETIGDAVKVTMIRR